ncbi:hypothetical protein H6A32_16065, partial [Drancourtella massiliensis]
DIPVPKANEGYEGGSWTPTEPTEETKVEDGAKYTYTFVAQERSLKVNYVMDDEKGTALKAPYTEATSYDAA